jgi:hypothetical protein
MPKITKSKIPTEHQEQVDFVQTFRAHYPQHLIFAVPNGDHRAISVAKRLKDEGVLKGVPDLVIVTVKCVLFLEMKRSKGGVTSEDQKSIHAKLKALGYTVVLAKGAKDAWEQLSKVLNE